MFAILIIEILLSFPILLCNNSEKENRRLMQNMYGENKEIKNNNYDKSLSITCNNGIFVGLKKQNVISFKGIPYAKPPIGDLRWKEPILAEDTEKVFQAYYFGKSPIQTEWYFQLGSYYPQGEDCLHLNIWLNSENTSINKPILVFFHGGMYGWGATSDPMYDGHNLIKKYSDIIFISVEFRLGLLGFINLSSISGGENYKASTNLGLLDQICALKWIQKNIKNIGGDPTKVTIMGQSSGASGVSLLPLINGSEGLFKRIIAQSGSLSLTFSIDETNELTKRLLKKTGAKNMNDLVNLSEETIININEDLNTWKNYAVRDGNILPFDLYDSYKLDKLKNIDMLIGTTKDEMRYFIRSMDYYIKFISGEFIYKFGLPVVYENNLKRVSNMEKENIDEFMNLLNDKKIWKITEFYNEVTFRLPMTKQAEYHSESGGNTYVYLWNYPGENELLGAFHNIDLSYTLNNLDNTLFTGNKVNNDLANQVQDMWINFVKNGNPSTSKITWEKFNSNERKIMLLDEKIEMIEDYKTEQREILEPLVEYYFNADFKRISYNVPIIYKYAAIIIACLSIIILIINRLLK